MAEVECHQRQGEDVEKADERISKSNDDHPIDIVHLLPMKVRVETSVGGVDKKLGEVRQVKGNKSKDD